MEIEEETTQKTQTKRPTPKEQAEIDKKKKNLKVPGASTMSLNMGGTKPKNSNPSVPAPKAKSSMSSADIAQTIMKTQIKIETNEYTSQMSQATKLKKLFSIINKHLKESMATLTEDERIMILQSGQKWNVRDKKSQDQTLDWIPQAKRKYANSKVTKNSLIELEVIDRWKGILYKLLEADNEYQTLQIKSIPWTAIFEADYAGEIGDKLIIASLITQNKYRAFRHSAFFATSGDVMEWLKVAYVSWEFVFALMNYAIDMKAKFKFEGEYYSVTGLDALDIDKSSDQDDLFGCYNAPTFSAAIAHGTCMDWRRVLRNSLFKNPEETMDNKRLVLAQVFQAVSLWMSRVVLVTKGKEETFTVDDSLWDYDSDLSVEYFALLQKCKRLYRAITRAITGTNNRGVKGNRPSAQAQSVQAENKKMF